MKKILAADLFCGAGGASTGFIRACDDAGLDYELLAINHWTTAVKTHALNHPGVRHLCETLERVDPREQVPGGRLHVLLAGPECTHFSTARGGRPVNPQSRASAWHIAKWAQELYIDTILIENVPEFRTWGPVGADGKPLKSKKGETFKAFLGVLSSLGYRVEVNILNAADYGDPTTRQRLFIMARRGKRQIRWPEPTHSKSGGATLFGGRKRWTAARQVIDWTIKGKSIFNRKKPLRPATVARILAGLEKFGGEDLKPFLVVLRNHASGRSLDAPVPTLAANGQHVGLAQPCLVAMEHGGRELDIENPLPTITTAKGGAFGVAEPFLLHTTHGGRVNDLNDPIPTVTGAHRGEMGVVEPFVMSAGGPTCPARPVSEPMGTVLTRDHRALVESFVLPQHGGGALRPTEQPLPTITTDGAIAVVQPYIIDGPDDSNRPRCAACGTRSVDNRPGRASLEDAPTGQVGQRNSDRSASSGSESQRLQASVFLESRETVRGVGPSLGMEDSEGTATAKHRDRSHARKQIGQSSGDAGASESSGKFETGICTRAKDSDWIPRSPDAICGGQDASPRTQTTGIELCENCRRLEHLADRCVQGQPFLVPLYGEREGQAPRTHSVDEPVPVIPATGGGKFGVVEPFISSYYGTLNISPASEPIPTVTTKDRFGLVEPFLASYYGQKDGLPRVSSIDEPIPTIPTENRFALVQPVINGMALDIHFRMLQPHELAAAMSFPKTYKFTGTREEVVKQIGNSWAGELSKALCAAAVQDFAPAKRTKREAVA